MSKKYEAVESRLTELAEVVDSCIAIHGAHLPAVTAAAIRAGVLRYAEGLLCLMTADELRSPEPQHSMFRDCLCAEIEKKTASAIAAAFPPVSTFVN
jgi:hypothetical protein